MQSWQSLSVSTAFSKIFFLLYLLSPQRERGQNKQQICGVESLGTRKATFHSKWKKLESNSTLSEF